MNLFGIYLNILNSQEEKTEKEQNLLLYIEEMQKKFISQIDELNLINEELQTKLEKSNKETLHYYNELSNMQECLKIQVETNNNLLKLVKENESSFYSKLINYFN